MRTPTQRTLNAVQRPEVYEEVVLASAGAPMVLSIWRAQPGAVSIVFLPGTMTHPLFYEDFLDGLNRAGFNVVGVHLQGHGKSPRTRAVFTLSDVLRNAADAVTDARERFGGPVVVLGSSQGGLLAMALAASGVSLEAVFAHNVFDPTAEEILELTRLPRWLKPYHRLFDRLLQLLARLAPGVPVPFGAYLDLDRVTRDAAIQNYFHTDPLGLRAYPLGFLASLFSADLSGLYDGRIRCPVVVVASTGDPLFAFGHIRNLYERIAAPAKELLVFDLQAHLIFNECLEAVLPAVVQKLRQYATAPVALEGVGSRDHHA